MTPAPESRTLRAHADYYATEGASYSILADDLYREADRFEREEQSRFVPTPVPVLVRDTVVEGLGLFGRWVVGRTVGRLIVRFADAGDERLSDDL